MYQTYGRFCDLGRHLETKEDDNELQRRGQWILRADGASNGK